VKSQLEIELGIRMTGRLPQKDWVIPLQQLQEVLQRRGLDGSSADSRIEVVETLKM